MSVSVRWEGPKFIRDAEDAYREGLVAAGAFFQGQVMRTLRTQRSISPPGKPPGVRTGTLARSIFTDITRLGDERPSVRVGSNLVYARIHEFGGVIRPKKAKLLAFTVGKGSSAKKIFTRKVTMPARPYLRPTFRRNRNKIVEVFAANVRKSLTASARRG